MTARIAPAIAAWLTTEARRRDKNLPPSRVLAECLILGIAAYRAANPDAAAWEGK